MKDRISQFMTAERLNPTSLADKLGVQRSGISHILLGRNKPSFDFIEKMLVSFPRLSADWLITGSGSMYRSGTSAPAQPTLSSIFDVEPEPAPKQTPVEKITTPKNTAQPTAAQENEVEQVAIFYTNGTVKMYNHIPSDLQE
jgi:transcriptional regulator with XRE-family HTH domain